VSMKPDWDAIQREYETSNIPYEKLAEKYGVNPNTLYSRSRKWNQESRIKIKTQEKKLKVLNLEEAKIVPLRPPLPECPSVPNAAMGAKEALNDLLELIKKSKGNMSFVDHQKASNAMAQYNDIIVNAAPESEEENIRVVTIDTRDMSVEMLALLEELTERMRELEIREGKRVG
jgi:transposase-like protein